MSISIDDLLTAQTVAQIRATMVSELVLLNVPADKWRKGGVMSTLLTVVSMVLALMSTTLVVIMQGFFLPTASGTGLKLLALYVYGVTVPDASFATGTVTLTNVGGGIYPMGVGEYIALNPATGQTYRNTVTFTLGSLATLDVAMAATNAGSIGNANPSTITSSVTSLAGVSVTNAASFVGVDEPTDAAVRVLCTNKLASLSVRGVRNVYAYAIQTATNPITLGPVNINRWAISESSHLGTVTLSLAAPSGAPDANDVVGVQTNVEAVARPSGVAATATAASVVAYAPTITVYASAPAGVTATQIKTAIDTAITDFIAAYPIGGVSAADDAHPGSFTGLFGIGIAGAIATGAATINAKVLSVKGATDLALTASQVASDGVTSNVSVISTTGGVLL